MAKRNLLLWGKADVGKSTFAATIMDPPAPGKPARWPRVAWINLDKPGAGPIARYFRPGSGATFHEPPDFEAAASVLVQAISRAKRGEIDALVIEGLSVFYSDDAGMEGLEHPDAIAAGGNAARGLYKAPAQRLGSLMAGIRQIGKLAKNPDFMTILTVHAKEVGDGTDRRQVPDCSRTMWDRTSRLCGVILHLTRVPGKAPKLTYKRVEDDLLLARLNDDNATAYFDKIHASRDEAALAQMRTVPGIVALLEASERQQMAAAAAADPKPSET